MPIYTHACTLALSLAALCVAGCTSSKMQRIDANREVYESWPLDVQEAVLAGHIEKGMTPDMVRVAVGKPDAVEARPSLAGEEEVWTYRRSPPAPRGSSSGPKPSLGGAMNGLNIGTNATPSGLGGINIGPSPYPPGVGPTIGTGPFGVDPYGTGIGGANIIMMPPGEASEPEVEYEVVFQNGQVIHADPVPQ